MTFPFSVRHVRQLRSTITTGNQLQILQYIEKSILVNKADNVIVGDLQVTYKGSTSNSRTSVFQVVDGGKFTLVANGDLWFLNYQIDMFRLFEDVGTASGIMFVGTIVAGAAWYIGPIMFLWLGGVSWIINIIRHAMLATEIAEGIDELICGKLVLPDDGKEDKMTGKLKHWM